MGFYLCIRPYKVQIFWEGRKITYYVSTSKKFERCFLNLVAFSDIWTLISWDYFLKYLSSFKLKWIKLPCASHYNPRFLYLKPHFWSPFPCFQGDFFENYVLIMVSIQERVMMAHVRYLNESLERFHIFHLTF